MPAYTETPSGGVRAGGVAPAGRRPEPAPARERDVRRAIREALWATGAFDGCWLTGPPEERGRQAGFARAVFLEPVRTRTASAWDSSDEGGIVHVATVAVVVAARDEDPETRDEAAERLLAVATDALNGRALGGLTLPERSRVVDWAWLPARPPERRIRATYEAVYEVPSWTGHDATE